MKTTAFAEIKPRKRAFLVHHYDPDILVEKVCGLADNTVRNLAAGTQFWILGIPLSLSFRIGPDQVLQARG